MTRRLAIALLLFANLSLADEPAHFHHVRLNVANVGESALSTDPNDWPTYNRDVTGTRHNPAEKSLRFDNVGQLVEKWRFPRADSTETIGVVHATVVVNGHVYFGTETTPTFYKLTPDG